MRVVDLSVRLDGGLPSSWPGERTFNATSAPPQVAGDGVVHNRSLRLGEHCGTHADYPAHVCRKGVAHPEAQIPLDRFVGQARVVDARAVRGTEPGVSPEIGLDVLLDHEATHGAVGPGDVVLVRTGWSERCYVPGAAGSAYVQDVLSGRSPGWPAPGDALLTALAERGVRTVGIDAPSIGAAHDPAANHLRAFDHDLLPVENLVNLGQVPPDSLFVFLPLAFDGGTAGPGRAVVLVER